MSEVLQTLLDRGKHFGGLIVFGLDINESLPKRSGRQLTARAWDRTGKHLRGALESYAKKQEHRLSEKDGR